MKPTKDKKKREMWVVDCEIVLEGGVGEGKRCRRRITFETRLLWSKKVPASMGSNIKKKRWRKIKRIRQRRDA